MSDKTWLAWFDCGTTNTRLYLVDPEDKFLFCGAKAIGSRNVAIAGTSLVLAQAMAELYQNALEQYAITQEEVIRIYASGMVTSAFGLKEIPHLCAPVSAAALRSGIAETYVDALGRTVCLIPGVKTLSADWRYVGNIRGEETEVFGAAAVLESRGQRADGVYILPGSHTQIVYLRSGQIADILSLFTGELFHALREETILSGTLKNMPDAVDPEFVRQGCADANELGINRALYLCHSNQVFQRFTPVQRYSYAEGVILSGVVRSLTQALSRVWTDCPQIVMVCDKLNWDIYGALLQSSCPKRVLWLQPPESGYFGVRGLRRIVGNKEVHYE